MQTQVFVAGKDDQTIDGYRSQEELDLAIAKERNQAIVEISQQVEDLAAVSNDLNKIVKDQQEGLDSIDFLIEESEKYTREGSLQLAKAETWSNKMRFWKYAAAGGSALVAIAGAVIVITSSSKLSPK